MRVANACLGNPVDAAGLELTGPGIALRFYGASWICVTGGNLDAVLDDQLVPVGNVVKVGDQQILRFGRAKSGFRAWLAVRGGVLSQKLLGSRAFDVAAALPRQRLMAGDMLEVERCLGTPPSARVPPSLTTYVQGVGQTAHHTLRYIPLGPVGLTQHAFTISQRANRTGFQIVPDQPVPPLWPKPARSEPLAPYAIQVPPDGKPFVLTADTQTIGGYPVAGHVCSVARAVAAQCAPGDKVQFAAITLDAARHLAQERERRFRAAF